MKEITNKRPETQRQLRKSRHGWEDNTCLGTTEITCESIDMIHLSCPSQHRNKPSGSIKAGVHWPAKQ